MRRHLTVIVILLIGVGLASARGGGQQPEPEYTVDFGFSEGHVFVPNGGNAFFSLEPGHFLRFEGIDEDNLLNEVEMTVTGKIHKIPFEVDGKSMLAYARLIEEREWIGGELVEVSLNFYARCPQSGAVYYFGEEVSLYEDGRVISHEGSWMTGVDGAQPGLFMPPVFLLGSRYFQEIAPGIAMDRAEHLESGLVIETPAGVFEGCVMILETSAIEDDEETIKVYAPGIGPVVDDFLELVKTSH